MTQRDVGTPRSSLIERSEKEAQGARNMVVSRYGGEGRDEQRGGLLYHDSTDPNSSRELLS